MLSVAVDSDLAMWTDPTISHMCRWLSYCKIGGGVNQDACVVKTQTSGPTTCHFRQGNISKSVSGLFHNTLAVFVHVRLSILLHRLSTELVAISALQDVLQLELMQFRTLLITATALVHWR